MSAIPEINERHFYHYNEWMNVSPETNSKNHSNPNCWENPVKKLSFMR